MRPATRRADAYAMFTKAPPRGVRAALERVGGRLWRLADHRRQRRARIEQHHQPHLRHGRRRRLSASRRTPSPALRSPAAAPISASPIAAPAAPTCSRPAPSCATMSVRPTSPPRSPMAGRTSPPNRTVTIAGIDQLQRRVQRQCLFGPASKAAIVLSRHGSAASASRPMRPAQFTTFDLPAYAEQVIVGREHLCACLWFQAA